MKQTLYDFCQRTGRQDLLDQWDRGKNGTLTPETVSEYSHKRVWWRCDRGHEWDTEVKVRTQGGSRCPICAHRQLAAGENDLATTHPDLAAQWHPTKNGDLQPCEVFAGSNLKVWWKCGEGHEWETTVYARATGIQTDCPVCAGKMVIAGYNDLLTSFPHLAEEWHPTKNGFLTPAQISPFSNRKVWWQCELGHEWEAVVASRSQRKARCPYCSGKRVLVGFNDLKTKCPQLAEEWHPTLNGDLIPEMVMPGTNKKIWWQCGLGHVWQAKVYSRGAGPKSGCPICAGRKGKMQKRYEDAGKEKKPVRMEDICVVCGAPVPEGYMVCWSCMHENGLVKADDAK